MIPNRFDKFLNVLGRAHQAQQAPAPSGAFEQNVMRRIRQQAGQAAVSWWESFQPMVMRFAAVSTLAAVLMVAVAAKQGLSPSYEVADLMLELQEETSMTVAGPPDS